jgi:hypothetical protein
MSNAPRLTYSPRPDATLEREGAALASAYRFLLFDSKDEEYTTGISNGEKVASHARKRSHAAEPGAPKP